MKQILKITQIISSNEYVGVDSVLKSHLITTDKDLRVGQSVLLKNGIVIGIVETTTQDVYEV